MGKKSEPAPKKYVVVNIAIVIVIDEKKTIPASDVIEAVESMVNELDNLERVTTLESITIGCDE